MKKTLLISIQPQWLKKILNGRKTIEVRRKVNKEILDKLDRGETVEAYLYCTKGKPYLYYNFRNKEYVSCDDKNNLTYYHSDYQKVMGSNLINGTIPAKVVIDGYVKLDYYKVDYTYGNMWLTNMTTFKNNCQLSHQQFIDYGKGKDLYALHISRVEVLDEVMKLGDFHIGDNCITDPKEYHMSNDYGSITRPPQNMMIVWVK